MEFLTKYNHQEVISPSGQVSMTDPQYLNETDINIILKKYKATGVLPTSVNVARFDDVSRIGDFSELMEKVNTAKADFAALPSELRERFGHDPAAFFKFLADPSNTDEALRLGLLHKVENDDSAVDVLKRIEKSVTAQAASPATTGEG